MAPTVLRASVRAATGANSFVATALAHIDREGLQERIETGADFVLVFHHGVGSGLFGFAHVDSIEAWVPLFLFSVLFGLSMDYQVFLLSRIRERYDQTHDTTAAVSFGVSSTARIITGAALIIVAVFAGFARGDLIDATIIRSLRVEEHGCGCRRPPRPTSQVARWR